MPVYTIVTANGKPAVLLNIFRQPDSNTVAVADAVTQEMAQIRKTLPPGVKLQTFYDQSEAGARFHRQRARRDPDRPDSGGDHSGAVPARLGQFAGGRPGDSGHHRDHVHRPAAAGRRAST